MNRPESYCHTQKSPLCLIVYAVAIITLVSAWQVKNEPTIALVLAGSGVILLAIATSFHHLRVADEVDRIGIRFGPLPLFSKTIRYEEISEVAVGRTTILDGWGIHMSLRGGWVWNIWGFDCVVIKHRGITRVGSDDAERLAEFLKEKIANKLR